VSAADPVFVGGSGRSGTTITGGLIAAHPRFAGVPFEIRVHVLTRLAARRDDVAEFREQALARFETHLHRVIDANHFNDLLDEFLDGSRSAADARSFIEGIMRPIAERQGKPSWVEMTPLNAMSGSWLYEIFPTMRLVHIHRDGRDVAASTSKTWRQHSVPDALDWWAKRVEHIEADLARLPAGVALTVRLEDLAHDDREATYERLLRFLEIENAAEMRDFYEKRFSPDKANIGRWARGLTPDDRAALNGQYRRLLERLRRQGITWVADPATID
jgi:hypothetical protein